MFIILRVESVKVDLKKYKALVALQKKTILRAHDDNTQYDMKYHDNITVIMR